jgi:hypothetical protein
MPILPTGWGTAEGCWLRLRYVDVVRAAQCFTLLAQAGAEVHLCWRVRDALPALYVGLDQGYASALGRMAAEFGLSVMPATAPALLSGEMVAGAWAEAPGADADAHIASPGAMWVRAPAQARDRTGLAWLRARPALPGAPIALPPPALGLHARLELPYASATLYDLAGQVCLLGDEDAAHDLFLKLVGQQVAAGRPLVVIDGRGDLAHDLRRLDAMRAGLASGRMVDIGQLRASMRGFNPLAEASQGEAATLARWRWWLRGVGVHDPALIEAAYRSGARDLQSLARRWAAQPGALVAAHAVQALLAQRDAAAWLRGNFDVAGHLHSGGALLVECPNAAGARLHILRGLLGLAVDAPGVCVLSAGVAWQRGDDPVLAHAGTALCWGDADLTARALRGDASVRVLAARCGADVAGRVAQAYGDVTLGEHLETLERGAALVRTDNGWRVLKENCPG